MAFRKLDFKNVQGTRASQTLQAGELAVDETTNQLYIGDQSTAGGNPVVAKVAPGIIVTASTTAVAGNTYFVRTAGQELTLPTSPSAGDFITVVTDQGIAVKDGASTLVTLAGTEIAYMY